MFVITFLILDDDSFEFQYLEWTTRRRWKRDVDRRNKG
jgi:hypothetical protein